MNKPTKSDAYKCLEIRKRTKKGGNQSYEEAAFVQSIFRRHPEWYQETEEEVFNDTIPFGSKAKFRKGESHDRKCKRQNCS